MASFPSGKRRVATAARCFLFELNQTPVVTLAWESSYALRRVKWAGIWDRCRAKRHSPGMERHCSGYRLNSLG